jgi:sterol desaturase/sphingolipid hydroxylase (fatty acid hydroxylase superfamily)
MRVEILETLAGTAAAVLWSFESRLALVYLCATVLLVYGIWVWRGRPASFLRFLLPREVYLHRSNLVDIKVFLANFCMGAFGLFGALVFTPVVTVAVLGTILSHAGTGFQPLDVTWGRSALATLVIVLAMDFSKYWAHYIHHEWRILWPFHALHHSAEVLTPLTAHRNHPVFIIIRSVIYSLVLGTVQAFTLFLLIGEIDILTIGSANAGYVIFNILGSNLRHSHVWLSYGRAVEHILISPAQHQIHHSCDVKHHNKNYGEVFAFWDWMFGTLYIPDAEERLTFGIADAEGNRIAQPHPTLRAALFKPFSEAFGALLSGTRASRHAERPAQTDQAAP